MLHRCTQFCALIFLWERISFCLQNCLVGIGKRVHTRLRLLLIPMCDSVGRAGPPVPRAEGELSVVFP